MDIFCEYMVKRKKTKTDYILETITILVAIYLSFLVFLMMPVFKSLTLLIIAAIWYGVVYLLRKKNIEYEYTLTNNVLDIDRIFAKKTRKRITSIDISKVDYIRPIEESDYEKKPELLDHNLCECKCSDNTYVLVFSRDSKVHRVFFTPNNKMKLKMKEINPARVTVIAEEEEE